MCTMCIAQLVDIAKGQIYLPQHQVVLVDTQCPTMKIEEPEVGLEGSGGTYVRTSISYTCTLATCFVCCMHYCAISEQCQCKHANILQHPFALCYLL